MRMSQRATRAVVSLGLVGGGFLAGGVVVKGLNADKVDGFHAVGPKAPATKRAGKLVATDAQGRVPDASRVGGFSHRQLAALSIPPGAATVSGATMGTDGPVLSATALGTMNVGFVVPPDHKAQAPLMMDLLVLEDSATACGWTIATGGLEGPDAPNSTANVHNGAWDFPGATGFEGTIAVPAGPGRAHRVTLEWPFLDKPGMFIHLSLTRLGADAADTCSTIQVVGLQLRY